MYLRDIWPSRAEIQHVECECVLPEMFKEVYGRIAEGNAKWNELTSPGGKLYAWDPESTYIKKPPFFDGMTKVRSFDFAVTGADMYLSSS